MKTFNASSFQSVSVVLKKILEPLLQLSLKIGKPGQNLNSKFMDWDHETINYNFSKIANFKPATQTKLQNTR